MPAFNDVVCPSCKQRIGWGGELVDCPPCPKCGFQIPPAEWEADEALMKRFEEELIARNRKKREERV